MPTTPGQLRQAAKPHEPIRQLLRANRAENAIALLKPILAAKPDDLAARELMFDAQFQRRSWSDALAEIEMLRQAQPGSLRYQRLAISTLSNMQRYAEAIAEATQYLAQHGEDVDVLNCLKVGHFSLGKIDDAVRYGQRVHELRDALCCSKADGRRLAASEGRAGKSLISFSLWGGNAVYNHGAIINLTLARTVYPDWTCRFYVGADVPQATIDRLLAGGGEVVPAADVPGLFARFQPFSDPAVARFIVRDCDSRLSEAEAGLVAAWVESGLPFHVIRDHVLHTEPMMGGLWGGRTDCGVDFTALTHGYRTNKYGADQAMLAARLWPMIRNHCLVHDRYYRLAGVYTLPIPIEGTRLGAGRQNLDAIRQDLARLGLAPIAGLDEGPVWR
jgi:hypothetical protein